MALWPTVYGPTAHRLVDPEMPMAPCHWSMGMLVYGTRHYGPLAAARCCSLMLRLPKTTVTPTELQSTSRMAVIRADLARMHKSKQARTHACKHTRIHTVTGRSVERKMSREMWDHGIIEEEAHGEPHSGSSWC